MKRESYQIRTKLFIFFSLIAFFSIELYAAPMFARKYNVSCTTCHSAFPKLNEYGKEFMSNNFRMPNWKDTTLKVGDDQLALPSSVPLSFRLQGFVQAREGEAVDVVTGESSKTDVDFQAPYLIKMLSSAPLSEHISYYFYAIFAEKGGNGEVIVEDAWFSYDDLFGSEISMLLGQFQVSDLMFPRETRLTFQDYMAYRMAGITYDRGVIFERDIGPIEIGLGLVNGNGINENVTINSPGYRRPDHMFDNNSGKAIFGRIGTELGPVSTGLFYYYGTQKNATGNAGIDSGTRNTDKQIAGVDFSGTYGSDISWFGQLLWNEWDGFIDINTKYTWLGGFVGADYTPGGNWSYSLLYNYADGYDFDNTDTVYEGIDINSLTLNASYYFMRNVKGVIEVNADFLSKEEKSGVFYTGHLTQENYILFGFDAAF
ncbi:hypothetical protein [Sulfurimonas sp.]|uniref:hypothetical protein n=1 Tax=Sulfurimonas sp. TaxID=2022749 RepID=UPI00356A3A1E